MAITYQMERQDSVLRVIAKGKDDNMNEVSAYSTAVIEAAIQYNSKKILCDERELEYSISVIDTFNLAQAASKYAINLSRIAIICDQRYLADGKFYETVATNRGLIVLVTSDYKEALKWLE